MQEEETDMEELRGFEQGVGVCLVEVVGLEVGDWKEDVVSLLVWGFVL